MLKQAHFPFLPLGKDVQGQEALDCFKCQVRDDCQSLDTGNKSISTTDLGWPCLSLPFVPAVHSFIGDIFLSFFYIGPFLGLIDDFL